MYDFFTKKNIHIDHTFLFALKLSAQSCIRKRFLTWIVESNDWLRYSEMQKYEGHGNMEIIVKASPVTQQNLYFSGPTIILELLTILSLQQRKITYFHTCSVFLMEIAPPSGNFMSIREILYFSRKLVGVTLKFEMSLTY